MGEIVELTTWPQHQNIFYKITTNAINFEVKAPCNAAVGLANKIGECDFFVGLGHNGNSWIKKNTPRGPKESVETPNILSPQEFRRFWITWYGDVIRLGRQGEIRPIVALSCRNLNLKFVTFTTIIVEFSQPVHWRLELPPPVIEKPLHEPITGGELHWVQVNAESGFPDDAYIGGFERENLYIIRAEHSGSLTPGKFVSSEGIGYISWGGEANPKNSFEVLCGYDCTWVKSKLDNIPVGAVVAGHSEDMLHEKLYIGRVKYCDHIIPGKVQPTHKVCYIAYQGKELALENYEIMVVPENNNCANKLLVPPIVVSMTESEDENDDIDDHSMNYEDDDEYYYRHENI